jgi:hypothetical protein
MSSFYSIIFFFAISVLNAYSYVTYDAYSGNSTDVLVLALLSMLIGILIINAFIQSVKYKFEKGRILGFLMVITAAADVVMGTSLIIK